MITHFSVKNKSKITLFYEARGVLHAVQDASIQSATPVRWKMYK